MTPAISMRSKCSSRSSTNSNCWKPSTPLGTAAHGGSDFKRSLLVTDGVIEKSARCRCWPLHNPANLIGIEAASGSVARVAAYCGVRYCVPPDLVSGCLHLCDPRWSSSKDYMVRRYGFHGTSHRYIAARRLHHCRSRPGGSWHRDCPLGQRFIAMCG